MAQLTLLASFGSVCQGADMTRPAPAQQRPIAIEFPAKGLSGWSDVPAGTHRVPDTQVFISGYKKGGSGGNYGVLGVAMQHGIDKAGSRQTTGSVEESLRIDTAALARTEVRKQLAVPPLGDGFTEADSTTGPVLSVISAVVMDFVSETHARPYVILQVNLRNAGTKSKAWTTRYTSSLQEARPFVGDGSWTADSAAVLRNAITTDLERLVAVMLRDVSTPFPRDNSSLSAVVSQFPYVDRRARVVGYLLNEDETTICCHAQRDLLQLTATESALRAGRRSLARALVAERLALKPRSPFNGGLLERTHILAADDDMRAA